MFGLFDQFNTDDPTKQARLAQSLALLEAGGPSRVPVSLFQGLGMAGKAGLEAKRQAQEDARRKLMQDMQLQQFTMQQEEMKRKQAQQDLQQQTIEGMNPMNAGPVPQPQMDAYSMFKAGLIPATEYMKATQPKEPKYTTLGTQLLRTDTPEPRVAYTAPEKFDPNKPFNMVDGKMVPNPDYQRYAQSTAKAGASNVSVNTGQKGFDNTLKLRGDFRSEPVYKAHQEMQSAYSQIQQSLKQASPAGDLAGATKIMKLLDPGSVVRESELGMAMAASGLLDRAQNYASMVISGQKLTPTQRKDFQNLADRLYGESVKQYNAKRSEYKGIADRNALDVRDVLGDESNAPGGGSPDPADPLGIRPRKGK